MCSQSTQRVPKIIRSILVLLALCLFGGPAISYWYARSAIREVEKHGGTVAGTGNTPVWLDGWLSKPVRRALLTDWMIEEAVLGDLSRGYDYTWLHTLRRCSRLERLEIQTLSNAAVHEIPQDLPLRELSVKHARLDDDGWRALGNWSQLRLLDIENADLGESGLQGVRRLRHLRSLSLSTCVLSRDGLRPLTRLHSLRFLSLVDTPLGQINSGQISQLTGLVELNLAGTAITDAGIDGLGAFRRLETLNLTDTQVTLNGLFQHGRLPRLKNLSLDRTPAGDTSGAVLQRAVHLEHLSLNGTSIGDRIVDDLIQLKSLNRLSVLNTRLTEDGIERIKVALPDCELHYGEDLYWDAND
ncbi:MAG: hypothetical protein ABGZ17_20865 [Planctomycetaceae bacterium]